MYLSAFIVVYVPSIVVCFALRLLFFGRRTKRGEPLSFQRKRLEFELVRHLHPL